MTLDDRLRAARTSYRLIGVDETTRPAVPPGGARSPRRVVLLLAAVVVVVVAGFVLWNDSSPEDTVQVVGPPELPRVEDLTEAQRAHLVDDASQAPAPVNPDIQLDPAGPYADGQRIAVTAPTSMYVDFVNGSRPQLCSVVRVGTGTAGLVSCDPLDHDPSDVSHDVTEPFVSVRVRLDRRVLTPVGERDCGDDEVRCYLVVDDGGGSFHASERLHFVGDLAAPEIALRAEPAAEAGSFVLRPEGLTVDPSWLAMRAEHPERADGLAAFWVSICSFGLGERATAFNGEALWEADYSGQGWSQPLLGSDCGGLGVAPITIDPDAPDAPIEVTITGELLGRTWIDCRKRTCFAQITRTTDVDVDPEFTGSSGEVVAAAVIPMDAATPLAPRPSMRILELSPHRQGDHITVEVRDLPDHIQTSIGVCHVDQPFNCLYSGARPNGSDRVTFTLHDRVQGCGLDDCYLQLGNLGKGSPPPATVALPIVASG